MQAVLNSIENAEDDILEATKVVLKKSINSEDVIIGIAASGNTPIYL
jgi:N-acetylmuramic acid 6-phosphate (MurNAc-6-P) etherase